MRLKWLLCSPQPASRGAEPTRRIIERIIALSRFAALVLGSSEHATGVLSESRGGNAPLSKTPEMATHTGAASCGAFVL